MDIESIKERLVQATARYPAPWHEERDFYDDDMREVYGRRGFLGSIAQKVPAEQASLIVHAPQDIADLIAEVERLTAERDALKRELDLERCVSRGLRSQVDELSIEVSAALRGMTARISEALHEWGTGYDDGEE